MMREGKAGRFDHRDGSLPNPLWRHNRMQLFPTSTFLRRVLLADAATCVASGLLLALGAGQLQQLLGLPTELSRYAGLSLLPFAAVLLYLATRENLSPSAVWTIIVLNALWTIDSILLLLSGWVAPNQLGSAFVVVQALGVAMFAALEYFGLRKSTTVTA
jgi:hypothetical protein